MSSFPTSMNAICVSKFGGPEVLELKTIPVPKLQPNQVLVRVHAAGVNPVETYMRSGNYARLPTLPWTPGNDGAGVIVDRYCCGVAKEEATEDLAAFLIASCIFSSAACACLLLVSTERNASLSCPSCEVILCRNT